MKKTILVLIFLSFLICSNAFAQEMTMPTDAEIMEIINKYDFPQSQKEYLFKETKRKLQESFASGEMKSLRNSILEEQNQNTNKPKQAKERIQSKTLQKDSLID